MPDFTSQLVLSKSVICPPFLRWCSRISCLVCDLWPEVVMAKQTWLLKYPTKSILCLGYVMGPFKSLYRLHPINKQQITGHLGIVTFYFITKLNLRRGMTQRWERTLIRISQHARMICWRDNLFIISYANLIELALPAGECFISCRQPLWPW